MSSHSKHNSKSYEYKTISSHDLKKRDKAALDEYLNVFGADGWDVVTISISETDGNGLSFLGLLKRKTYKKEHRKH